MHDDQTKHIVIRFFYVRDKIEGVVKLLCSQVMVPDFLKQSEDHSRVQGPRWNLTITTYLMGCIAIMPCMLGYLSCSNLARRGL